MIDDLFADDLKEFKVAPDATLLKGHVRCLDQKILTAVNHICKISPFRYMTTPGGHRMSVAMTCCGEIGWTTDRTGYRYTKIDPQTGHPWPKMPKLLKDIGIKAARIAGFPVFDPDSCIINQYAPKTKLSLHQDKDEVNFNAPVVSISLGLPAIFLFGGKDKRDFVQKIELVHGDVLVWGGKARLNYHGVLPIKKGMHSLLGDRRICITLRQAQR